MTSIVIVDFDLVRFINFEAEINFPEEEGTIQVEHFACTHADTLTHAQRETDRDRQ